MKVRLLQDHTIGKEPHKAGAEPEVTERVGQKLVDKGFAVSVGSNVAAAHVVVEAPAATEIGPTEGQAVEASDDQGGTSPPLRTAKVAS